MLVFMHMYAYRCWLTSSKGLVVLKTLCVQVSGSAFSKRLCPSTWVVDENLFTFAVSTLVSSYLEHSPNAERLHIPPCCVEPKKHWQAWAAFMGALGGKRGSTRCELKRPSFGCLTNCLNGMGRCLFSPTFTDRFIFASRFSRSVFISLAQYTLPGAKERWAYMSWLRTSFSSTAIGLWKHRIPSDLRS